MSKKWVAFLLIVCVGLGGMVVSIKMSSDTTGPEIIFSDQAPSLYHADMSNSELLTGISAKDDTDGDVSSSLTVESVYEMDDSHVIVTYTAKDSSNNITKKKYEMEIDQNSIKDIDSKDFGEVTDESESSDTTGITDTDDSDETDETKEAEETKFGENVTPTPDIDEAEEAKQKQEAEADAMPTHSPRIYLTDYLVKVPVGTSVDLLSYVSEIKDDSDDIYALWRKVQITGEVNSAVPGTYKCTYYVIDSQNNISNNAVLTVIVE